MSKEPHNPELAYQNLDFLNSDICRPIRLQAEFLYAHETMKQNHIDYTVVVFGSARIKPPEVAEQAVVEATQKLEASPNSKKLQKGLKQAKSILQYSKYYTLAQDFSRLVSESTNRGENNAYIITGGGPGIMEAGNRGAHDAGCPSVALNIKLPFEQYPNPYVTEKLSFQFHYFSIRKIHFLTRARALCAFPGGFGTMDELFETLTLIQTGKVEKMPIVLFGTDFWKNLINWDYFVEAGLIEEDDLDLFHYCDNAEEGWQYIQKYWKEKGLTPQLKIV